MINIANINENAKIGTMKLMPPERNLQVLKDDYEHMQNMIFGEKIPFDTILDGIEKLEKEMNQEVVEETTEEVVEETTEPTE